MTVTIKLDTALEEQLRRRVAATGRSTSEVVRAALQSDLAQGEQGPPRSAFGLGGGLFGRDFDVYRDRAGRPFVNLLRA